ncbi:hypothetical protein JTB14_010126 [Gonioctena quinquepunctata]|nr:hypothetical protein JTB14_010126 [Gonioctena quinquepunctata]
MDVAVFRTVKAGWKENVHKCRLQRTDNPTIKKCDFCPLLAKTLEDRLDVLVLRNGFKKCGLVPWNPEAVSVPIQNPVTQTKEDDQKTLIELQRGKTFLENHIDNEKVTQFKANSDIWTGPIEDLSLYNLYTKII